MGKVPRQRRKLKTDIGKKNGRSKRTQKVRTTPVPLPTPFGSQPGRPIDCRKCGSLKASICLHGGTLLKLWANSALASLPHPRSGGDERYIRPTVHLAANVAGVHGRMREASPRNCGSRNPIFCTAVRACSRPAAVAPSVSHHPATAVCQEPRHTLRPVQMPQVL